MERCRFCYKAVEVEFCKNIFNNEQTNPPIPKIVEMLTNLTIVENDPYTKLACLDCFNILVILYNYRETILQTNQLLIENEINMNNNKNDGNFHKNWPRIKRDDDGQFIVINNNNSANLTEATLQIKSEPDGEDHTICNNNQHSNISMDNDEEMAINDNENGTKTDNYNQQLDNSLCIKGENEQILGFIKDEIKIEDVCLKIESEPDDEGHTICNNNQHSNISMDNDEEMTNNDNKNGTNINNYNEQSDENSLCIERNDERLGFAKDELEIEEICSEIAHTKKNAENDIDKLLPEKSSHRYWKEYEQFIKWCGENDVSSFNEYVLLAYFEFRSKHIKSSTLWSIFSMLKSTINIKHSLNIDKYTKLIAFLKRKKIGYLPKKSKTLEIEEIRTFINEAPNEVYLMIKVALIIATCAACRRHELPSLGLKDVKDRGDVIVVTIPDTKTKKSRTCCITEPLWIDIIRKYLSIRPAGADNGRFFLFYSNNKCSRQPVGIHSFGNMPCKIATFLKLENPAQYTGHCFRRSGAKILAGRGADKTALKRHGDWKSSTVAKGYIDNSLKAKTAIANQLNGPKNDSLNVPTSSASTSSNI